MKASAAQGVMSIVLHTPAITKGGKGFYHRPKGAMATPFAASQAWQKSHPLAESRDNALRSTEDRDQNRQHSLTWAAHVPTVAFIGGDVFELKFRSVRADVASVDTISADGRIPDAQSLPVPGQRFVARQPIFDRTQKVFGYELLFRDGLENCFAAEPEFASRSTLDSSLLLGLNTLCDGRLAFVNCTRDALLKDLVTLLPPDQTVVEILETVEPGDRVIAACKRLKTAGYLIALDDFAPNDPRASLCDFADILKVDFRATRVEERAGLMRRFGTGRKMLAEKLETPHEFRQARDMGFSLFQGYFFRRPEIMMAREVPASKLHYVRLLEMVCRVELDMRELEKTIKQETAICYRLLRYLNSPLFGFSLEITSIRHAMAILGERELRRWIDVISRENPNSGEFR